MNYKRTLTITKYSDTANKIWESGKVQSFKLESEIQELEKKDLCVREIGRPEGKFHI